MAYECLYVSVCVLCLFSKLRSISFLLLSMLCTVCAVYLFFNTEFSVFTIRLLFRILHCSEAATFHLIC